MRTPALVEAGATTALLLIGNRFISVPIYTFAPLATLILLARDMFKGLVRLPKFRHVLRHRAGACGFGRDLACGISCPRQWLRRRQSPYQTPSRQLEVAETYRNQPVPLHGTGWFASGI